MGWGFVGLGQMGLPMARRLSQVTEVLAYDHAPGESDGIARASTLVELSACEVILTCLPNGKIVEEALFGKDGLADRLTGGPWSSTPPPPRMVPQFRFLNGLQGVGFPF